MTESVVPVSSSWHCLYTLTRGYATTWATPSFSLTTKKRVVAFGFVSISLRPAANSALLKSSGKQ